MARKTQRENVTGVGAFPERARRMAEGLQKYPPSPESDGERISAAHREIARNAPPLGSVPHRTPEGNTVPDEVAPIADKLGARLAFERAGTRLYELLLDKHDAAGSFPGGPTRDALERIRDQEYDHFRLLERTMKELGADPTAMTPSADLQANAGKGVHDVIADSRTTLLEGLEAVLVAELTDNESWEALVELAEISGYASLAEAGRRAIAIEEDHLAKVRGWVQAGQGRRPTHH